MGDLLADIILPVPLPQLFTYLVPENLTPAPVPGMRVVVPFGKKKQYSGIVAKLHHTPPVHYETKPIIACLDSKPVVLESQIRFWEWMAGYYQCSVGEVYRAALPSGLKMESETHVLINPDFEASEPLDARTLQVLDFVALKKVCTIREIVAVLEGSNAILPINRLIDKGAIFVSERLKESFKPKTLTYVFLASEFRNEQAMESAFKKLEKAPRQLEAMMHFISTCGYSGALLGNAIPKQDLTQKNPAVATALGELIKKGFLTVEDREIGRINTAHQPTSKINVLSPSQNEALQSIAHQFTTTDVVLLHGVTSSGKTEIYIHLIEEQLKQSKQVLYLLPEIALTTQITSRLKRHFGNRLGIYHSKYSDAERVEIWNNLLSDTSYEIILGARSAIFLPFTRLGLIIVDEEHENSYKQYDPAPRYHARDAAVVLAKLSGAKTLLGTATPSLESYYNAQNGRFGFTQLFERHQGIEMPEVIVADTSEAKRKKQMKSHFTPTLLEELNKALTNGEQAILFQNRRGFAPYIECGQCAWVPKCKHCDVSMTYHKQINHLTCHYCGFQQPMPITCPACGLPALETRGFGTEKIEEEIKIFFPDAKVARMDLDTARTKKAHENIISDFEQKNIDILIGTQMISKGLDFDNVSVVGILNADSMLNYPDFRAYERSFQLMAQVSGRAGRKNRRGTVVLQTANPTHPVILDVINNNYSHLYETQLAERETFKYPPFYRLIQFNIKHVELNKAAKAADNLALALRQVFGDRVLGPQAPVIGRIQNYHIRQIIIKLERKASPAKAKEMIQMAVHSLLSQPVYRSVIIQIDVDPM
jgi:primosomal protein N' (replication factor Y)